MEKLLERPPVTPLYKDTLFRAVISFPVAVYMMLYREKENFFEAFFDLNFWIGVVFSYCSCLLLLWLINKVSRRLDAMYDWRRDTLFRILHQFCWGQALMVILVFLLVSGFFFFVFSIDIRDTKYISHDLPLVVLFILLGNFYYMAYYLWIVPPPGYLSQEAVLDFIKRREAEGREHQEQNGEANGNGQKKLFLAVTKEGTVPVQQEDVAAIFRQGDYILLRTFDRQTYTLEQSIADALESLDTDHFFRINPRYIVNYRVCKKFRPGQYGKLELELGPPLGITEEVSRTRARDFAKWMER